MALGPIAIAITTKRFEAQKALFIVIEPPSYRRPGSFLQIEYS